ncbi:hypothetical protein O9H85_20275 [Paenibacillus filicis]|uniref:Uncharacterized protein n=1 Tax=Paenibacillus gyeongsangnamensis TaxID=3388067 RepID=A0ABT4QDE5_9BACL|nr:hypothetical protein [Paenibacillus filicis]MCZ8514720.1 hypothetical protein [Paenibacillus filicis]
MENITLEKMLSIERQCVNAQDAVIIRLLIEGIEINELVYLTNDSLDLINRLLTIADHSGRTIRTIVLSKRCVELFRSASDQTIYILDNGYSPIKQSSVNLRDSDSLIKISFQDYMANESMITEMDSVILRAIYRRLKRLAEIFSFPELVQLTTGKLNFKSMSYA